MLMIIYAVALAQIGVGWLFIRYLIQQDRGPKEPPRALMLAGLFGLLAVVIASFAEYRFLPADVFEHPESATLQQLINTNLMIGFIEEAAKSVPLAIFLFRKRYFDEMTDGVIYFGIAGMVFGVAEDIGYAISMGPGVGLMRIIISPFIHAAFCALFGLALSWVKVKRHVPVVAILGLVLAMLLHGIYDLGLSYGEWWSSLGSLALALILNYGIFLLLRSAQKYDAKLGLAAEGDNLYCRECGAPNPNRYFYCTSCGKKT